jgi:hypothetical protein
VNSVAVDILHVIDPRFQGGTGAALAAEAEACVAKGYTVGLLAMEAQNLTLPFPMNPRLAHLIETGQLRQIPPGTPVSARLALLHNPYTAGLLPISGLNIRAEVRMMVVHHPPVDATGAESYDLKAAMLNAEEILSGPVEWAPVGPLARGAFDHLGDPPDLRADDWTNVIDLDAWRRTGARLREATVSIGRHSRPDLRKFPATREEFATIYGTGAARVDILGAPGDLTALLDPVLPDWRLRPFGAMPVHDYLDQLDAFVYYHRSDWVEAFGYAVLEAMARGVPCVLPESLGPVFGKAALLRAPEDALEAANEAAENPAPIREAGWDLVHAHHSFTTATSRVEALIGPPRTRSVSAAQMPPPAKAQSPGNAVLLLSTNGVGQGHFARTIAIARRLRPAMRPVLVTMSQSAASGLQFDMDVEFLPFHHYLGTDSYRWNLSLGRELVALADTYGARALVFDGNSPFQGVLDCLALRPELWGIWCRRGMWRPGAGAVFMERERYFDAVIEPGDIAGAFDVGPTRESRSRTRDVDPIRLLDHHERLSRDEARAELGLSRDPTALLVQLGSGNNYDYNLIRHLVLRRIAAAAADGVIAKMAVWSISEANLPDELPDNVEMMATFPIARYLAAFDGLISAAGYNSYHEAMDAGVPAIWIPNENPAQDDQLARARFAERHGAGLMARRDNAKGLLSALDTLLDADSRAAMSRATAALVAPNGAAEAARIITDLSMINRGERRPPLPPAW